MTNKILQMTVKELNIHTIMTRKEEFENTTEVEKELDKQRGYFGGLVGKIIGR